MTSEADTQTGAKSHRERVAESTRTAIIDAFLALAHSSNAVTVSIPAVAERAGVSVRTVYRYFTSKDELQSAAAYRNADDAVGGAEVLEATTLQDLEPTLTSVWSLFAQRMPAVYAEHTTPAGRELRLSRLPDARERVARAAGDQFSDDAVDLIVAVTSSSLFLELVGRMGHTPEHAAALAVRLCKLVIADELPELRSALEGSTS